MVLSNQRPAAIAAGGRRLRPGVGEDELVEALEGLLARLDGDEAPENGPEEPEEPEEDGEEPAEDEAAPDGEAEAGPAPEEPAPVEPAPEEPEIDPPASWPADARDVFKALPAAVKQVVVRQDQAREAALARTREGLAAEIKALADERTAVEQDRKCFAEAFAQNLASLKQKAATEFARTDWNKLAAEDPAQYAKLRQDHDRKTAGYDEVLDTLVASVRRGDEQRLAARARSDAEQKRLAAEKVPDADPRRAPALETEIRQFLAAHGFAEGDQSHFNDHRALLVVMKAIEGERLKAAQARSRPIVEKKLAGVPPRIVKPAAGRNPDEAAARKRSALLQKLARTGNTHDQAAILAEFLPD